MSPNSQVATYEDERISVGQLRKLADFLPMNSHVAQELQKYLDDEFNNIGQGQDGIGKHGNVVRTIETVKRQDVYVNDDFIVRGANAAEGFQIDPEAYANSLFAAEQAMVQRTIGNSEAMQVEQTFSKPLYVLARPNPQYPRVQTLMLLHPWEQYHVYAEQLQVPRLEVCVFADMPDYDVRMLILQLRMFEEEASAQDTFRQLVMLYDDYVDGKHLADSPAPVLDIQGLGRMLGKSPKYIAQLITVYRNEQARQLIASGNLALSTAQKTIQLLKPYPDEIPTMLTRFAKNDTSREDAIKELERLVARLRGNAETQQEDVIKSYKSWLAAGVRLLDSQASTLGGIMGDDEVSVVKKWLEKRLDHVKTL